MNVQTPYNDFLDVLGISPEWMKARSVSDVAGPDLGGPNISGRPALSIFADAPSAEEAMVLGKIIAALKMDQVPVQALVAFNDDPDMARMRLCFTSEQAPSVTQRTSGDLGWDVFLPVLSDLVGDGPEVVARKRLAWGLLKQILDSDFRG